MLKLIIKSVLFFYFLFVTALASYPSRKTWNTAAPITLKVYVFQKILGFNRMAYWPTHHSSVITNPENILIGIGTAPGLSTGCFIQGFGNISIGDYTLIGPNVGIISGNHNLYDYRYHDVGNVKIGKYCWIGMNSVILPNVELGDHTIVAAGSIVTKSFMEGYCVIAGNPAKIIKKLNKDKVVEYQYECKYHGYIQEKDFEVFKDNFLNFE